MAVLMKICGVSTPSALEAAMTAQADYVGLVFFPPSPRNVSTADAAQLAAMSNGSIRRVGLFVDAADDLITDGVNAARLDVIQLHGDETPDRVAQIKHRFGLPVWKAIPVATAEDVNGAGSYEEIADMLLFDAKTPKGARLPGGMGLKFNWSLLSAWKGRPGWGLAGGLDADNVAEAITIAGPALVDTSSGVETSPGQKDPNLIATFCNAARNA